MRLRILTAVVVATATAGCTSGGASGPGGEPGWHPRGELVYVTLPADQSTFVLPVVHTIGADGAGAKTLRLSAYAAAWSRDGTRLLADGVPVTADDAGPSRPALVSSTGKVVTLYDLPGLPDDVHACRWTPDEEQAVCTIERAVVRVDLATGEKHTLARGGEDQVWDVASDGRVAFLHHAREEDHTDAELWTVELDGSGMRQLTRYGDLDGSFDDSGGSWLPDGSGIVAATPSGHLVRVDADTGDLVEIPLDADLAASHPDVSPDGTEIAFQAGPVTRGDIYATPIGGGPAVLVTGAAQDERRPEWRPREAAAAPQPVTPSATEADQVVDAPGAQLLDLALSPDDVRVRASTWRLGRRVAVAFTDDGFRTRTTVLLPRGVPAGVLQHAGPGVWSITGLEGGNYRPGRLTVGVPPPLVRSDGTLVPTHLRRTRAPLAAGEVVTTFLVDLGRNPATPRWHMYSARPAAVDPGTGLAHLLPRMPVQVRDWAPSLAGPSDAIPTLAPDGSLTILVAPIDGVTGSIDSYTLHTNADAGYWHSTNGGATWQRNRLPGVTGFLTAAGSGPDGAVVLEEESLWDFPHRPAAWWRSSDGGTTFERVPAFAHSRAEPDQNGGTPGAVVLADGRLVTAVPAWTRPKAGLHVRPTGLYVSRGVDWSRMDPVPGGDEIGTVWWVRPCATGALVRSWTHGDGDDWFYLYDGSTITPVAAR